MSLRPDVLLSSAARARCIANIKELPMFTFVDSPKKKKASVLVPLCIVDDEVCLLYTLRSSNLSTHSGQVSFPGGKQDADESVFDTALRETEEEIGFSRENVDLWTEMHPVQGRNKNIIITPVIGQCINFDKNKLIQNKDEVEEIFTVPMSAFCDTNNHAHFMYKVYPMPVFLGGKHKIWGITGMITHFFLTCFLSSDLYNPNFLKKVYQLDDLMPAKL